MLGCIVAPSGVIRISWDARGLIGWLPQTPGKEGTMAIVAFLAMFIAFFNAFLMAIEPNRITATGGWVISAVFFAALYWVYKSE